MTQQQLTREQLNQILQTGNIEDLSLDDLTRLVLTEPGITNFAPDGICQVDPRNGERIIYNTARARRPHDNRPTESTGDALTKPCVICRGETTGIIDVADLGTGFTFINKNLFPVLFPEREYHPNLSQNPATEEPGPNGIPTYGFHFLQWTSSLHDKDWHNLPQADRVIVMNRLAALEKTLLAGGAGKKASKPLVGGGAGAVGISLQFYE